jgi:predicted phage-related endonuclease
VALAKPGHFGKKINTTENSQGERKMSLEIEPGVIELDDTAQAWLLAYKKTKAEISALEEKLKVAREHLEFALGDSELALIKGQPVIRWTRTESHRFDTKKAREILPAELIGALETTLISRRFSIVEVDE